MGNFMGKAMEDNLKKNQEFMLEINRFEHPDDDQDADNFQDHTGEADPDAGPDAGTNGRHAGNYCWHHDQCHQN